MSKNNEKSTVVAEDDIIALTELGHLNQMTLVELETKLKYLHQDLEDAHQMLEYTQDVNIDMSILKLKIKYLKHYIKRRRKALWDDMDAINEC